MLGWERASDRLRHASTHPGTHAADHRDRLDGQPPQGEGDGLGCGRVPPLQVIHRNHERLRRRQRSEDPEHGQPKGHAIDARAGSGRSRAGAIRRPGHRVAARRPEKRNLQGTVPRYREVRRDLVDDRIAQQGCEPSERQVVLGFSRPARQDTVSQFPGALDGSSPKRRLADPGGPVDGEQPGRATVQKPLDRGQLKVAPDDLVLMSHRPSRCEQLLSAARAMVPGDS